VPLSVRFPRLYDLNLHRSCTVAEARDEYVTMGRGRGGVGVAASVVGVGGRVVGGT
jgi:hypothetical protein